jgi:adenylate cyclase
VVAFDIILSEPDRLGALRDSAGRPPEAATTTTDAALAAALEHDGVVTSYAFTFDAPAGTTSAGASTKADTSSCALQPLQAVQIAAPGRVSPSDRLFEPSGVICSLAIFNRAAGASGFLNVSRDPDGVVRRVPLVIKYHEDLYPSLGLAAVQHLSGTRTVTISATSGQDLTLDLAGQMVPIDAHGRLLPRFRSGRAFRLVGASDVLDGRLRAGSFTGQIVFIGSTALGVDNAIATPLDTASPGVEVHAAVAESLLGRNFIAEPTHAGSYELGSALAAGLAVAALTVAGGLLWGALGTVLGCVCLWMLASRTLETHHTFFSPVLPMLSATISLAVLTSARVVHERRRAESEQRRRLKAQRFIVDSLTSLTEARDSNTGRHVRRTQGYTRVVASELAKLSRFRGALTPETIELMAILAPLHDIGKVGIPDAVLNKPGPLTSDEYERMRTHPRLGYNAIVNAQTSSSIEDEEIMALAKEMVLTHHEWWDGHGYPRGLIGEQIPIGGRVLAIVDVYDALVGARPYRVPMTHEQAVAAIRAQRGTHFDPDVVDAFVAVEQDIETLSKALNAA